MLGLSYFDHMNIVASCGFFWSVTQRHQSLCYFDYWGKGTKVTVSSAQPSAPKSIFALSQCPADSSEFLTVGCLTKGFSPADSLTFKWKAPGDKDLDTFVQYPAFGSDGDYTKISHMRVKKSDWIQNPYTCEASNSIGSVKATVTPRPVKPPVEPPKPSPPKFTLTLRPPVERELFVNNKVVLEAVVSGDVRKTVQEASVSCTVKNAPVSENIKPGNVFTDTSLFIRIHNVTIDEKTWFDGEIVTCTIRDTNNNIDINQKINFDKGDGQKPNVAIYRPDLINKDTVSVVCEVTSQKLGNVYIMWKVGGKPYIEAVTSAPIHQNDSKSVLSILTVSKQEYEDLQTTIACAVKHANMKNTRSPLQVTTSKREPPEPEKGFALNCNKDVLEEDEFRSLWSTATSFIFLFLFSLTYSAVLSLFKMKN